MAGNFRQSGKRISVFEQVLFGIFFENISKLLILSFKWSYLGHLDRHFDDADYLEIHNFDTVLSVFLSDQCSTK